MFKSPVPEFIATLFEKTSPKRSFSIIENERFGLVFTKTEFINYFSLGSLQKRLLEPGNC
jgi:hypothetical protein